jgi:long-subunit fatty acid transport protein
MRTLIAVLLLCPALALAGGFATPNPDARAMGMAQAGVANQTGPEALTMNVAGLAGPQGWAFSASLQVIDNQTSWTDPTLGSATTATHPAYPPLLGVSYGGRLGEMAWGAGAGLTSVGGGSLHWPQGWAGRFHVETVSQQVLQARAGAAIEPVRGIKLGAAAVYYYATEQLSQALSFGGAEAQAEVGASGGHAGYVISLEATVPGSPLKLGADYRARSDLKLTGKAHFSGVPAPFQTQRLVDQAATTTVLVVPELNLGLSWQASTYLELQVAWTLEGWHVYKSDDFVGDKGFAVHVPRDYRDANDYRIGFEYAGDPALKGISLRAGVFRSVSAQPTSTLSPSLSDASSWNACFGLGVQVTPSLRIDGAYQYAKFDPVTASGPEALAGTYVTSANVFSVGVSWRR